jgi:hypothetical protein
MTWEHNWACPESETYKQLLHDGWEPFAIEPSIRESVSGPFQAAIVHFRRRVDEPRNGVVRYFELFYPAGAETERVVGRVEVPDFEDATFGRCGLLALIHGQVFNVVEPIPQIRLGPLKVIEDGEEIL